MAGAKLTRRLEHRLDPDEVVSQRRQIRRERRARSCELLDEAIPRLGADRLGVPGILGP
jgi:hypothetical protein